MEKELEEYKAILGALPQSMFLMDKDKTIIGIFNASSKSLAEFSADEIVGKNLLEYVNDTESPFYQACSMLNSTFDLVFETGTPLKFQYKILDTCFEVIITKIPGDRILSQVQDITEILFKQQEKEEKKHNELSMALMAGGLISWYYDVQKDTISSKQDNNVIGYEMTLDTLLSLIVPENRQITIDMLNDIAEGKSKHGHVTVQVINREGILQWSDVHAIPHEYKEDGKVSLIIGSQKDVTKEYEDNEKLKKLVNQNELILNNTSSGFVYITTDLKIEWENISNVFSDPDVVSSFKVGHLYEDKRGEKEFCCTDIIMKALKLKTKFVSKYKITNGIILECIAQPVFNDDNEVVGIVLRIDDITLREETLCKLAEAKEKAEQSDKLKSSFLANMSHEIRTPLNSIVGFAQLIAEAETEEEKKGYTEIVNSNSDMLLNLINDILDLSKIEAGYFTCNDSVFNLPDLFIELEAVFRYRVHEGVEFSCNLPCEFFFVNLDRVRISQVLTNFMTNALKFTKKGSIKMGFEMVSQGVKLYVKDTGCGMTEDEVKRVFGRFEKFNLFEQGTGLGTSIAKAIVDVYNGKIGAESAPDEGSTFWAILPTNIKQHKTTPAESPQGRESGKNEKINEPNGSSLNILIAEDNDSNYMLIKAILKGNHIIRACNGLEALNMAKSMKFDIILMDIQMPIMDGVEATQSIRAFNSSIPIIAVTANAFDEDKKRAYEAGINNFISKPLNKARLLAAIKEQLH